MSDDIIEVDDETFLLRFADRVDHEVTEQGSGHLERWHAERLREIATKLKSAVMTCAICTKPISGGWALDLDNRYCHHICVAQPSRSRA